MTNRLSYTLTMQDYCINICTQFSTKKTTPFTDVHRRQHKWTYIYACCKQAAKCTVKQNDAETAHVFSERAHNVGQFHHYHVDTLQRRLLQLIDLLLHNCLKCHVWCKQTSPVQHKHKHSCHVWCKQTRPVQHKYTHSHTHVVLAIIFQVTCITISMCIWPLS